MRSILCCLLLTLPALLGGCSSTVFESLPEGTAVQCDPAWPGRWIPHDSDATDAGAPQIMEITSDCRNIVDAGKLKPLNVTLIRNAHGEFLDVRNDSNETDCVGENHTYCGHVLWRYQRDGDILRVYAPDHAKIAEAILQGRIGGYQSSNTGRSDSDSDRVYRNFVAGNPQRISKILQEHPEFFVDTPSIELQRAPAVTPAENAPPVKP